MKLVVLYVEDEPNDVFFFKRATAACASEFCAYTVDDGDVALEWIAGRGKFSDRKHFPRPDVIVLDLKLPRMHGFEVLKVLKSSPQFSSIPVVIYSSSLQSEDINTALANGAWSFIGKSSTCEALIQELRAIASTRRTFLERRGVQAVQVFA